MRVAVIGAGAAGSIAAVFLARGGEKVCLFDKNDKVGKKLYITGKGRCNVTNDCEIEEFLDNVVHGNKFLRSALYGFKPSDTMEFFESLGVPLVTERGNRVFPLSGKSSDIIRALTNEIKRSGVDFFTECDVKSVSTANEGYKVSYRRGDKLFEEDFDRVIVATGGITYPSTGSTGDGYNIAKGLGHSVTKPVAALSSIVTAESVKELEGISLKNVSLTALDEKGGIIRSEFGEMLFTNNGLSGPIALSISSYINRLSGVTLVLDLKPALDEEKLSNRIMRDFEERKNQDVKNVSRALLPDRLNMYVLKAAKIDENKKVNFVTKEERQRLCYTLKNLTFKVKSLSGIEQAVITSGGISTKELTPCGESKLHKGLYFVGETADVDALTGGFNLQIAFATGVAAARDILKSTQKTEE